MTPIITNLVDEYLYLEGFHPSGLGAWNHAPLEVRFEVAREEVEHDREPTAKQLDTLRFHLDNQEDVRNSILDAFMKEYPKLIQFDGGYRSELPDSIEAIEAMATLLELNYIQISSRPGANGLLMVGFAFESKLDPEHGLGCRLDGARVVTLGGESEAW